MASDQPSATQWLATTPEGEEVVVVEVTVTSFDRKACVILLDRSDSSGITPQDVRRLRKVLQVVPRDWTALVRPFDGSGTAPVGLCLTVGEVVDGAADIEGLLLSDDAQRRGRAAGSFLGHAMRQADMDRIAADHASTLVFVLTDGRLHDIGSVRVPDGVTVLGMAVGATCDARRWQDVLPDAEFLEASRPDTVALVRRHAGCSFLGPCRIEVPGGRYRLGGALDASRVRADLFEGVGTWDFSRGAVRIEIPAVLARGGRAIEVRAGDGSTATLKLAVEAAATHPREKSPGAVAVCHVVDVAAADARALVNHMDDLVGRRAAWQEADGCLALMAAAGLPAAVVSAHGLPCCDAMVVIVPEQGNSAIAGRVPVAWVPLACDRVLEITQCLAASPFTATEPTRLMFHRLDARWLVSVGGRETVSLPPRGGQELSVRVMTAEGVSCRVFFSGSFRAAAAAP